MLSDYLHVQNVTMQAIMDSGGYLCMTIPTIKRRDLDGYEIHNVQIMQLWRFKISTPTMTAQADINTPPSLSRKMLASDYY